MIYVFLILVTVGAGCLSYLSYLNAKDYEKNDNAMGLLLSAFAGLFAFIIAMILLVVALEALMPKVVTG